MNYRTYRARLSPPWLQAERGAAFQDALGSVQDELIEAAKTAALVGHPEHAPADALGLIGDERQVERGPDDSDESYRERLRIAYETWRWAGTRRGLLTALNESAGLSTVDVITNRDWQPAPPDGDTAKWARFHLVIAQPHVFDDDGLWADDSYWFDDDGLWGTTASEADVARIHRLISAWKPGNARCLGIVVNYVSTRTAITTEPDAIASLVNQTLTSGERIGVWGYPEQSP